ncbi:MAG: hypothetical protein QOJ16_3809, partial [Acidobacteriota bacterium]|nr:hypothetical protein [Acidobacteriota bacterium]
EPEPLLSVGERQAGGSRLPAHPFALHPVRAQAFDMRRQLREGRSFEDAAQRQLDRKAAPDAGDELRSEERVPAKGEEVVPATDPGDAEELTPDRGDDLLGGMEWLAATRHDRRGFWRPWQGPAIELAVGVQGERGEGYEGRRQLVLR